MESDNRIVSSGIGATPATAAREFSKFIAATYLGLGLVDFILLAASLVVLGRAVESHIPLLFISGAVLLSVAFGCIYTILALRQRHNWARYAALSF